jgi:hypothetical protein
MARSASADVPRPSYLAALGVSLAVAALYFVTLAPSTAMWDTSEYIAAAYVLGLPHPPGNPLFVLLGKVFTLLPVAPGAAMRVNVLAAVCSAASAGLWFLITERVLASWMRERWQRVVGGALAALVGATAFTVWSQSVVNEKVYTVALVGVALIAWLTVRWSDEPDGPKADRWLVLIAYLLGLGYANHMAGFLAAPAVGLAVVLRRPRTLARPKLLLAAGGALVLGMTPFATQPIRAAFDPAQNTGEVTACTNGIGFRCTFSQTTWDRFLYNFNREQYGKPSLLERQATFPDQVGMWWLYFKWQWMRDAHGQHSRTQLALAVVFFSLGILGAWVHWKHDRRTFWFFGPLMFTMTLLLVYYMNFKLGWTQAVERGLDTSTSEVRDRDYFFLWSFSAWGVWVAVAVAWLTTRESGTGNREPAPLTGVGSLFPVTALGIALIPLITNWHDASIRAGGTFTREWARDVLNSVEPYGILITNGDNDTFPLWYAQAVEGVRPDVIVAVTSYLGTDWFVRQIIRRKTPTYDAAKGPAIYRATAWKKPTTPPLAMTPQEADAIPPAVSIGEAQRFRVDSIEATIPVGYLTRDQIVVLRFIADSFPGRPLYFSNGGYERALGLGAYAVSQGLVTKLLPLPAKRLAGAVELNGRWVDVERSRALWQLYGAQKVMLALGDWVDGPSANIPAQYVFAGATLANALEARGDREQAAPIMEAAFQIAKAARIQ